MFWWNYRFLRIVRQPTCIFLILLGIVSQQVTQPASVIKQVNAAGEPGAIYLPIIGTGAPFHSFYGVEILPKVLLKPNVVQASQQLGARWVRINGVSWRAVQPQEGDTFNWSAIETLETQISVALSAGLTPVVVIVDSPTWATGRDSTCAAVQTEHLNAFAAFIQALVTRFQQLSLNVYYWELGNEPDVDARLVAPNSGYGCWGDIDDREYYGGQHYGEMLKVVTPAIKSVNPDAKVITGGLLLGIPNTTDYNHGKPERFFEGILKSGAAPFFDIVAYHEYIAYTGKEDNLIAGTKEWADYGGMSKGKPTYLRQIMARYHVSKPLILNETALLCDNTPPSAARYAGPCYGQTADFIQVFQDVQAELVAPLIVRALGEKVESVMWFTLSGGGWRYADLLDARQNPRPAYYAFQTLIAQTGSALDYPISIQDYGTSVEAYRFVHRAEVVDVVWSPDRLPHEISVPEHEFTAAYDRYGNEIILSFYDGFAHVSVTGSAVYIHRMH